MSAINLSSPISESYCAIARDWLCSKKSIQTAKATLWFSGSAAAFFIPVPFLNGMAAGAMIFMGSHELFQHPESVCMNEHRTLGLSRTWKHLLAGAVISGAGWGASTLLLSHKVALGAFTGLLGVGAGLRVAYSDSLFQGNYTLIEMSNLPVDPATRMIENNQETVT